MMPRSRRVAMVSLAAFASLGADAQPAGPFAACAAIEDPVQRLACYDAAAGRAAPSPPAATSAPSTADPPTAAPLPLTPPVLEGPPAERSWLADRWAIGQRGLLYDLRPHEPTYLLFARGTTDANQLPQTPTQPSPATPLGLNDIEAKFQISFKFRLAEFGGGWAPNLWGGYTQQSQWQVYNGALSRPFRETNYQPELMLAWHPDTAIGAWRWRLLNVGLVHQSNGRSDPFSRSWNRLYAQFGVENGRFGLLVRPWYRFRESIEVDDNPDIVDYLGHGDVVAHYRWGEHIVAAKARANLGTRKGYLETSWSLPVARNLRAYAQLTTGHGESLIDYNWKQTTFGLGVALADWQ